MTIALSSTALSQISNHDVKKYVECKLYNTTGTYLRDILVQNASYSKSRQFAVNSMNIQVPNTDKIYTSGQFEIKQDYIIVLIEGYDTGIESDKIPTFRGRVKDLNHTQSGENDILSITCYGELMLLQRSDLNKVYIANTVKVNDEILSPVIDNKVGNIDAILTIDGKEYVKIIYDGNLGLRDLMLQTSIHVENHRISIVSNVKNEKLLMSPLKVLDGYICMFYTGTNSFNVNDVITSVDGETFIGTYVGSGLFGATNQPYLKFETDAVYKNTIYDGMILIEPNSGNILTANIFYIAEMLYYNDGRQNISTILSVGDKIHNGLVDKFRATNNNWAAFKLFNIIITTIAGDVNFDDSYDGYDVSETLGIVKLNEPILISEQIVTASYYYYPQGLFVEDIITDLLIEPDALSIDLITDGKFKQDDTYWVITGNNISSTDYVNIFTNGININTTTEMSASQYISIVQNIPMLENYTYNYKFNIQQSTGSAALWKLYINNSYITSGVEFIGMNYINSTYVSSGTGDYDFEIRLYNIEYPGKVRINDIQIKYNPAKNNSFTTDNLYCKLSIENGNTAEMNLKSNLEYAPIPRFKTLVDDIELDTILIKLDGTTGLDASGYVKIDDEIISYSAISGTNLLIDVRGIDGTVVTSHVTGKRCYQTLSANRVWYLPYNNIIPATVNSTASDYGYPDSINLVSGNFTISGASYTELFYREGIIITSASASNVVLNSGVDYIFNQIQTTGIETPYILIDYKQLSNRYDALNEILSMLAPNFVINETVRKIGSTYNTYIRGRYLVQSITHEYELDFISDITYSEQIDAYNRVKMFGKTSNPTNLMYADNTRAYETNVGKKQYLKGVQYIYNSDVGSYYSFKNDKTIQYNRNDTYGVNMYRDTGSYNKNMTAYAQYSNSPLTIWYNGDICVGGAGTAYDGDRADYYEGNEYVPIYNIYNVNYLSGIFSIGDTITDGVNNGIVKYIVEVSIDSNHNAIIFVEHTIGTPELFENSTEVSSDSCSAVVYRVELGTTSTYKNFNQYRSGFYSTGKYKIIKYAIVVDNYNIDVDFSPTSVPDALYIDGVKVNRNTGSEIWEEIQLELPGGTKYFEDVYEKNFDSTGLHFNTKDEWENDIFPTGRSYGIGYVGTVILEKVSFPAGVEKRDRLSTLNYKGQPGVDIKTIALGRGTADKLYSDQLREGKLVYRSGVTQMSNNIEAANRIIFYRKYAYNIDYFLNGDQIYISKADIDGMGLKPTEMDVKVDGEYDVFTYNNYNDTDIPFITRIRNNIDSTRENQASIVSRTYLEGVDLFVIDLGEVTDIGIIDLQAGYLIKPTTIKDDNKYDIDFNASIYYSDKDEDYEFIDIINDFSLVSDKTEDLQMTSGIQTALTSTELGEYFKARYIKVRVNTTNKVDVSNGVDGKEIDYYGAAISSIAIYGNGIITSEKYVDADVINLYKDNTVYEQLNTQELVDTYAQANLDEFQKDNTTVTVNSPIGTHYDIGMTVKLNDLENSIDKNYFIEEVSTQNGATTLSIARYE